MDGADDHDLGAVRRVLAGDREAFRGVVERHAGRLLALARGILAGAADGEDVVQDAFVAAFEKLHTFDPGRGSFGAWLFAIVRHRALNVRKKKRPEPRAELPEKGGAPRPEPEVFAQLDRALARLTPEQRSTFLLAEAQGLPHAEVARIEGVAVGTVKSRVARAKERLRAALETPERRGT